MLAIVDEFNEGLDELAGGHALPCIPAEITNRVYERSKLSLHRWLDVLDLPVHYALHDCQRRAFQLLCTMKELIKGGKGIFGLELIKIVDQVICSEIDPSSPKSE